MLFNQRNSGKMKCSVFAVLCLFMLTACTGTLTTTTDKQNFVKVDGSKFSVDGKPYYFFGTNFWFGLNLGAKGTGGNRERLIRELDRLQEMGINNLRIMAGSEGPDDQPYRMLPSLQSAPGQYNEDVAEGLDFLLEEMRKRKMYAVMCMNNFWNWSGGVAQYLVWSGKADSIPHPPPHPGGSWSTYQEFAAKFYSNEKAIQLFNDHLKYIINRKNSFSGVAYKDDPAIMSWELANEPRGINNKSDYKKWIRSTCKLIKELDPNHLVTLGSEGTTSSEHAGVEPEDDHSPEEVDYMTIHIWVQNWNIYNPQKSDSTLPVSVEYAVRYMDAHEEIARRLKKPVVLEEFGISRDGNSHEPTSTTKIRDEYYKKLFADLYRRMHDQNSVYAGVNFWAWAGEGRPRQAEGLWKPGDDFIGDPPHEPQGWYSVYDTDSTTIDILREYAAKINKLGQ
jgi:mannan endo-1,4-beta-mannosidase